MHRLLNCIPLIWGNYKFFYRNGNSEPKYTCKLISFSSTKRAMAVCISSMVGRLGSISITNLLGFLLNNNCEVVFISSGALLFGNWMIIAANSFRNNFNFFFLNQQIFSLCISINFHSKYSEKAKKIYHPSNVTWQHRI